MSNDIHFHRPLILNKPDQWESWDHVAPKTNSPNHPPKHMDAAKNAALVSFSKSFLNGRAELMEGVEPPSALCWQFLIETVLQVQLGKDNELKDIVTTDAELWEALGCSRLSSTLLREQLKHLFANAFKVQWWWASGMSARWIDRIFYSRTTPYLVIRLSSDLKQHIFNLKQHFCQLSVEAMRELTKQRHGDAPTRYQLWYMRFRQDTNLDWGPLKMMLDDFLAIGGVPSDHPHAKSWWQIKAKFVTPLQKALAKYTDITLEVVKPIRLQRRVIGFRYQVHFNNDRVTQWKRRDQQPGIIITKRVLLGHEKSVLN